MTELIKIIGHLDDLLTAEQYSDMALNGLQVESDAAQIDRVAFAVDAGLSVINKALTEKAQLLIVHHGLFWGSQMAVHWGLNLEPQ